VEFGVLGPLRVVADGREISLRSRKQRALLAFLVLHAREVVSIDRLLDELWGERPPPTAKNSLQNHVHHLRTALGADVGADVLRTRPPGYVLDVDDDAVDAARFVRLLASAGGAPPQARAETLRTALALWRGRALADVEFEPFALAEAPRLDELRAAAEEELVAAELELGKHAELVARLEELVGANPLRERLRGQLMLALYRSGRQGDALAAYRAARRTLVEELGIEPGRSLRVLEAAILRQDPALDAPVADAPGTVDLRERRTVATVLHAELDVEAELDPERHRATTAHALHELRAAAEYHGGTVERLAGDELVAVFGVPARHEDDPLRAVRAALQISRSAKVPTRIALDTGEVLGPGAGSRSPVVGAPLSAAKRLAEAAPPGIVVATAATHTLVEAAVDTEALKPLKLRGQSAAVTAVRIDSVVEERAGRVVADTPLVGRGAELAAVRAAYADAVAESRSRVFGVFGEAGLGKTRLARELVRGLAGEAEILVGRCVSYGEGATWLPLREIVRASGSDVGQLLADTDDGMRAADILDSVVGAGDAEVSTLDVFWAARRFLEARAARRPVVVVIDDVHWAEAAFLDFVAHIASTPADGPIFLLVLARPEVGRERPELGSLELRPLADDDVRKLVESTAVSLPDDLRERIPDVAEGNPLFAEQLVAYAEERGAAALSSVPPTVEALLAARLDLVGAEARAVLQRAAVVGREFWQTALLHLTPELEVPAVGRHLEQLSDRGLVHRATPTGERQDAFRFHHVLIRDVAYSAVPKQERSDLHEAVAEWLEAAGEADDELVGYHLEQAYICRVAVGRTDRHARSLAVDAGERLGAAGVRAWRRSDAAAAVNLIGRAVTLLPERHANRPELLCELGVALRHSGRGERAGPNFVEALETATKARDRAAELRARIEIVAARLFADAEGAADELLDLASTAIPALEELGADRALGRIWINLGYVHGGLHCRNAAWRDAAERARTHYARAGWPTTVCRQEIAAALFHGPTPAREAIASCRRLLDGAERGGEATVAVIVGGLEAMRGRPGVARRVLDDAQAVLEELGLTLALASSALWMRGQVAMLQNDNVLAERHLRESCGRLQASGDTSFLATGAADLAQALYALERYDEASSWTDVAESAAASDDVGARFQARSMRAKLLARGGFFERALVAAEEALALVSATDALNQHARVLLDRAEILQLAERHAEAAAAAEAALELFEEKENTVSARKVRALLNDLAVA